MSASSSLDSPTPALDRSRAASALLAKPAATLETRDIVNGVAGPLGLLQLADSALANVPTVGLCERSRMWLQRVSADIDAARKGLHALAGKCRDAERAARGD